MNTHHRFTVLTNSGMENVTEYPHTVIFWDPAWWVHNEDKIKEWYQNSNIEFVWSGMTLSFTNEADMTLFLMRWS